MAMRALLETETNVSFKMGGKGGVGKTGLMVTLAEWFEAHEIPFTLLDLDTENKPRGSLKHFFNGSVTKVNIHTPADLDTFIDHLESGTSIILADMGANGSTPCTKTFLTQGRVSPVGVVTPDPASVESVLAWANPSGSCPVRCRPERKRALRRTSATGIQPSRQCGFGSLCHRQ